MVRVRSKLCGVVAGLAILAGLGITEAGATSLQETIGKAVSTNPRVASL